MNTLVPTIADLFPATVTAGAPVEFEIGRNFDTASMPELAARRFLDVLGHIRPHPVGAAIARGGQWVLILPADAGEGMHWPWPVDHRDTGLLSVPPLSAGPGDVLHWARLGNGQGRVFTAPLPLYAALPLFAPPGPPPATDRLDRDRTPVRI